MESIIQKQADSLESFIIPKDSSQNEEREETSSLEESYSFANLEEDLDNNDGQSQARVSSQSKVNISKLTNYEKKLRFKNMSKTIQKLESAVRTLKSKVQTLNKKYKNKKSNMTFKLKNGKPKKYNFNNRNLYS